MSRSILKSMSVVGSMTLVSRITGLLRDMAYAQTFGAAALMDVFLVAYKLPNFLRRLFAEGAFSQSFVPVISEYKVKRGDREVANLVSGITGTFGVVLLGITLIGVIAAPIIILVYAPGFTRIEGKAELAVEMLRWTFPYLFFVSITAAFSGLLNSYGRFAIPAVTQVIMNIVMIVFTIALASGASNPGLVLSIGVFVSGLLQVAFQLPSVARLGLLKWPRWRPKDEGVRRVGSLMLPGIFGSSMSQVSLMLDSMIASFLVNGSIAWLYYGDRIMEFALGVFSIALATVILPDLSRHHAEENNERFSATLDWAIRLVVLLATPAAVGLLVLAGPLTATIFGYGKMSANDVRMTTYALMAYSWGLLAFSLVKVLAPGFFARQDTRTPVRTALIGLGVTMAINVGVVLPAKWAGFTAPHALIATATCVGAAVNAALLLKGLRRSGIYHAAPDWPGVLLRMLGANVAMAAVLWWLAGDLAGWVAASPLHRAARLAGLIAAGIAVYFGALFALGIRQAHFRTRRVG